MEHQPPTSIAVHFATLTDPRVDRTKAHRLGDISTIALCGVLCGASDWVATRGQVVAVDGKTLRRSQIGRTARRHCIGSALGHCQWAGPRPRGDRDQIQRDYSHSALAAAARTGGLYRDGRRDKMQLPWV